MNRQSLEVVELCDLCKQKWKVWPKIFFSLLQDAAQNAISETTMEQEQPAYGQDDMDTMKPKKTVAAKGAVRRRRAAKPPPPSRSRNTNKGNVSSPSTNHGTDTTGSVTILPPPCKDQPCEPSSPELTLRQNGSFHQNTFGYTYQQKVEVLNINGHWYSATLVEIDGSKIKVRYEGWHDQDEWILMGSRRLRTTETSDDKRSPNNCDFTLDGAYGTDNDDDGDDASSTMSDFIKGIAKNKLLEMVDSMNSYA